MLIKVLSFIVRFKLLISHTPPIKAQGSSLTLGVRGLFLTKPPLRTDTGTERKGLKEKGERKKKSKQNGRPGALLLFGLCLRWFYVVAQCLLTVEGGFVHA